MEYDCAEGSRDMPEWLLLEIFLRLPIKSIFRFKSVSKHWCSLITDPSFARSYTNFEIYKNGHSYRWTLLFCYMNTCFGKVPPKCAGLHAAFELCHPHELLRSPQGVSSLLSELIYQSHQPDYIKLLACDNGLLLCCDTQQWQELYFVCNPLTLHWVAIPRRSQLHKWVSIGFMVEPEDGSFMVVRIAEFSGSSTILDLETFSSREGKWIEKKLVCDSPVCLFIAHRQAVPFRGIFHWREYNNRIVSYNPMVETNQCRLIDMPRDRARDGQGVLRVSHHRLRYFEICTRYTGHGFYVWVLENYELGEWCLQFKVPFDEIWSSNRLLCRSVQCHRSPLHPLTFHPLNSEVVYLMCGDRLASSYLKEKRLEIEREDRFSLSSLDSWTVVPFVLPPWPTLVPKPSWQLSYKAHFHSLFGL